MAPGVGCLAGLPMFFLHPFLPRGVWNGVGASSDDRLQPVRRPSTRQTGLTPARGSRYDRWFGRLEGGSASPETGGGVGVGHGDGHDGRSLDHPVDNAPVRTLEHKGLTLEGYSRAAVQTYWRVPELKLGFDLGAQPWSFMSTPNWFVSHTHLDHIAALPVYVARRRMMKMEPPTIYLPAEAVEGVEQLLRAFQKLDRGRMPAKLVGRQAGRRRSSSRASWSPWPSPPGTRSPRSASWSGSVGRSSSPNIST